MTTRTRKRDRRPVDAPTAPVVGRGATWADVLCPYCGHDHRHAVEAHITSYRVAPGCGMVRTPDQRLTGYRFTISNT